LCEIGAKLTDIPEDFNVHPLLKRIFKAHRENLDTGKKIDMATTEALAWGTLLYEGFGVRLSGKDVERGTFSHRLSILIDKKKDRTYVPFHALMSEDQIKNE
jgi:2-oxoglutarate dehydrogenase E1 component